MEFETISEIHNNDFLMEDFVSDLDTNDEWIDYLKRCEEWNEDIEEDDLNKEIIITPKRTRILYPCFLEEEESENKFYILGNVKKRKIKSKSFKYNKITKQKKIFCDSVLNGKICSFKKCEENHKFSDILYCKGNCDKINNENNYYTGVCNKRHYKETFENFVLRKKLKIKSLEEISLKFFKRPSEELLEKILIQAKQINIKSLEISMCEKPKKLEDYYKEKITE